MAKSTFVSAPIDPDSSVEEMGRQLERAYIDDFVAGELKTLVDLLLDYDAKLGGLIDDNEFMESYIGLLNGLCDRVRAEGLESVLRDWENELNRWKARIKEYVTNGEGRVVFRTDLQLKPVVEEVRERLARNLVRRGVVTGGKARKLSNLSASWLGEFTESVPNSDMLKYRYGVVDTGIRKTQAFMTFFTGIQSLISTLKAGILNQKEVGDIASFGGNDRCRYLDGDPSLDVVLMTPEELRAYFDGLDSYAGFFGGLIFRGAMICTNFGTVDDVGKVFGMNNVISEFEEVINFVRAGRYREALGLMDRNVDVPEEFRVDFEEWRVFVKSFLEILLEKQAEVEREREAAQSRVQHVVPVSKPAPNVLKGKSVGVYVVPGMDYSPRLIDLMIGELRRSDLNSVQVLENDDLDDVDVDVAVLIAGNLADKVENEDEIPGLNADENLALMCLGDQTEVMVVPRGVKKGVIVPLLKKTLTQTPEEH